MTFHVLAGCRLTTELQETVSYQHEVDKGKLTTVPSFEKLMF